MSDLHQDEKHNVSESERHSYGVFGSYKISMILLLVFVIFIYIIMFSILHKNNESSSGWVLAIEIILWITLIIIIVVNIKWLNDKDFKLKAEIDHLFDDKLTNLNIFASQNEETTYSKKEPEIDISDNEQSECNKDDGGEVFHIESNTYTYDDAKGACKLLGARLATYEEVERSYQNGANWCSYGWSDEQLALFPIQASLYNELKTIPGHQHDCGRPGVNGGYIEDDSSKFGVNCYGKKPYMTEKDANYMKSYTYTPTMSPEDQSKIDNKINDILIVPFNKNKWSFE